MRIYFVRHGEGHHNANNLYSMPEFELTEKGKGQALAAAKRINELPIELIVASPYKRTLQTTEIINNVIHKEVILSDLAVEIKRPKEIAGKVMSDPEIKAIRKELDDHFHLSDWHYSDEENFFDLRTRAQKFIKYLETLDKENILVVTHAVFIKMVILTMMLQDNLEPSVFLKAYDFMTLQTSGITICERKIDKDWQLITWNDHSHL